MQGWTRFTPPAETAPEPSHALLRISPPYEGRFHHVSRRAWRCPSTFPCVRLADGDVWSILFMRSDPDRAGRARASGCLRLITGHRCRCSCPAGRVSRSPPLCGLDRSSSCCRCSTRRRPTSPSSWPSTRCSARCSPGSSCGERPARATFIAMIAMAVGVLIIVSERAGKRPCLGRSVGRALSALHCRGPDLSAAPVKQDFGFTPMVAAILPAVIGGPDRAAKVGYMVDDPVWIIFNGLVLTPFAFWALAVGPKYLSAAETGMFYCWKRCLRRSGSGWSSPRSPRSPP